MTTFISAPAEQHIASEREFTLQLRHHKQVVVKGSLLLQIPYFQSLLNPVFTQSPAFTQPAQLKLTRITERDWSAIVQFVTNNTFDLETSQSLKRLFWLAKRANFLGLAQLVSKCDERIAKLVDEQSDVGSILILTDYKDPLHLERTAIQINRWIVNRLQIPGTVSTEEWERLKVNIRVLDLSPAVLKDNPDFVEASKLSESTTPKYVPEKLVRSAALNSQLLRMAAKKFPLVTALNISSASFFRYPDLTQTVAEVFPQLHTLTINNSYTLESPMLVPLQKLVHLQTLNLSGCIDLRTVKDIAPLNGIPSLTAVDLSYTSLYLKGPLGLNEKIRVQLNPH